MQGSAEGADQLNVISVKSTVGHSEMRKLHIGRDKLDKQWAGV